ncbi:6-phosphogluconate dehydrogenase [Striga asiatica]|uniref:6-phosphogluconate dehydrogenase n=1 Tax=Striga asiatica TaxID=4170 RepID=A0A5A7Q1Z2_STRAF|nr:6-phosphogluconate dehydrogenase [Striga asiatica]
MALEEEDVLLSFLFLSTQSADSLYPHSCLDMDKFLAGTFWPTEPPFLNESYSTTNNVTQNTANHGNWKEPPIWVLPDGGEIATHKSDIVMAMRPDQTKTMVGVLPRLPMRPLAKG